jgi:EAL domain-containing protein (putative c-di-GMP-specific phosphodiesterase class I)
MKIDKSFVIDLDESPRHLAIVRTTVEMARSLGLTIVAEGIENAAVEALLKEQGCDLAQGFYYQKPVPFELYLQQLQLCDDAS